MNFNGITIALLLTFRGYIFGCGERSRVVSANVNEVNENKVPFTKKQQLKYNRCYAIGRNYEVLFYKEFQQSLRNFKSWKSGRNRSCITFRGYNLGVVCDCVVSVKINILWKIMQRKLNCPTLDCNRC